MRHCKGCGVEVGKRFRYCKECGKERKKEGRKRYRENNKEKILKHKRDYERNRKENDPMYKLRTNISSSISKALKSKGLSKNKNGWGKLVGYTKQDLKEHLESLFTEGMTWDNQGRKKGIKCWEIDHIIPQTFFKYTSTDDVEFKYCWSLNNLQPLWAKDNFSKGNRIIKPNI